MRQPPAMHGAILKQLKTYVVETHGREEWYELVEAADTDNRSYLALQRYPDGELEAVAEAAAAATDTPTDELLESFGQYLGAPLVDFYRAQIDDDWGYFDLLEHTDEQIREAAGLDGAAAAPPAIEATREGPAEVHVRYASDRELCPLARGLLRGLAAAYGREVSVEETACMREGADACRLVVTGA